MVGATLGGGVGPYGGLHGLQIDALQSVRMVTGAGNLITVSATQHPDLFWGLRGAGFNFGVVTSATYQVYPYTNNGQAMNADFRFNASANASLYEFARSYTGKQPDAFSIDIAIAYNEDFGGVSLPLHLSLKSIPHVHSQLTRERGPPQTYLFANFIYAGPLSEGLSLIQPILALKPFQQNITMIPWSLIETTSKFGTDAAACIKGNYHSVWGLNLYQIDVPTLSSAVEYMDAMFKANKGFRESFLAIDMYATRVTQSVPDEETAYPYRSAVARLCVFLLPLHLWQS